jgi:hypothetical protein
MPPPSLTAIAPATLYFNRNRSSPGTSPKRRPPPSSSPGHSLVASLGHRPPLFGRLCLSSGFSRPPPNGRPANHSVGFVRLVLHGPRRNLLALRHLHAPKKNLGNHPRLGPRLASMPLGSDISSWHSHRLFAIPHLGSAHPGRHRTNILPRLRPAHLPSDQIF